MCSTPDIEVSVEPTVVGRGVLLSQGVVLSDTQHPNSKTQKLKNSNTQTPKHPNTQTPKHPNTQTPKHPNTQTPKHPLGLG
jgi:hypothetical protein